MAQNNNGEENTSKGVGILVVILIIISFLSTMCLLIKCDVGGFGSEILRPVFKDVPVINKILPDASDKELAKETDYPYKNYEDALAQIEVMDASISSKDAEIAQLNDKIGELQAEVDRLNALEMDIEEFNEEKNKFFDEIVYGESAIDTDNYIEWYNSIDKERAEEIYADILEANQADEEIKELAASYEAMDPKKAAKIFESMKDDMDTVALIMNNMSSEAQGKILAEMDSAYAASVTKKLLP